jgi:hypothetical protein
MEDIIDGEFENLRIWGFEDLDVRILGFENLFEDL